MTGNEFKVPNYYEGGDFPSDYHDRVSPGNKTLLSKHDLLSLSRYARSVGKKIVELSKTEIDQFRIPSR